MPDQITAKIEEVQRRLREMRERVETHLRRQQECIQRNRAHLDSIKD